MVTPEHIVPEWFFYQLMLFYVQFQINYLVFWLYSPQY
jgi:quinol-cytochrome oxidoreductase complex cytochrome b subunit